MSNIIGINGFSESEGCHESRLERNDIELQQQRSVLDSEYMAICSE
jgi:hypothetical protein